MTEKLSLAERRMAKPGILRLDLGRPRKTSAISFEMDSIIAPQAEVEPVSPQLSVDRLSVTFAEEEKTPEPEKIRFHQKHVSEDDDDYSATFNAFMTRQESRGSRKRRTSKRRGSSPFSPDPESYENRRQSSVITNSSETAVTMEDTKLQEQIFHKMRVHKEVLNQVKHQPWPMHRKLKLVRTAKAYIKRHEGALHERLAHNKSTKDVLAHFNIIMVNQWHYLKREIVNLSKFLIPWESSIKEIESHFGSVVASYFTFLRWLFSVNLVTAIVLITFVCIPEVLMASKEDRGERKGLLPSEEKKSKNLLTLWNFEGILKYSPMFYGYYNTQGSGSIGFWYRIPHAYFMTGLGVYIYSFVAILRKYVYPSFRLKSHFGRMAENSRQSKLSEKDDECAFSWKIFTGWDYMIGNSETAHNRTASIILGFKEALLEEEEKKRDQRRNWKMTTLRIFTHLMVLCLIFTSVYVVILVVRRSTEQGANSSWWRQSEVTIVVTLIGFIYPILFDGIGMLERYHPRKALRMQLARIMVLNLLNLYSFIFATFSKISTMSMELRELAAQFKNVTKPIVGLVNLTTPASTAEIVCRRVEVDCFQVTTVKAITVALLLNLTTPENVTIPMDYDYDYNNTLNYVNDMYEYNTTNATNGEVRKCWIQRCVDLEGNVTETDLENWNISTSTLPTISGTAAPDDPNPNRSRSTKELDHTTRKRLRQLCWETMFGQELVKLTIMDMVITVASVLFDFFRAIFVRTMNNCWCWDLEKRFPQYGDFKIAENILHLVNNQGMVWMGMFFSPGLPLINLLKLAIVMHMRSWAVLTCNVPHEVVFKASRSNNFYFALLLTMLFLCVLPVGYAVVWVDPSWHCGPFSNHNKIYHIFTSTLKKVIPSYLHKVLDYIASPGIVIPLLMLLILIIYYLVSLTNALREANDDLKIQLRRERTEERRKVFQLAEKRRKGGEIETSFNKWRRIINSVPEGPKTPIDFSEIKSDSQDQNTDSDKKEARLFFKKKRKQSNDSDEGIPQVERDDKPKGIHNIIKSVLRSKKSDDEKVQREREDSTVSGWSADIPEIKIIETDSNENTLTPMKEASSSETVVADEKKRAKLTKTKQNHDEDESLGIGESYESIADSIRYIHDLTNEQEGTEMRKIKARKAIANALVNEVRRRKLNES